MNFDFRTKEYMESIREWADLVSGSESLAVEYFYDVLCDVGYVMMLDGQFPDPDILKKISECFRKADISESYADGPSFTDFDQLFFDAAYFGETAQKTGPPPFWGEDSDAEREWENALGNLKALGIDLIMSGLLFEAALLGEKVVNPRTESGVWQASWARFTEKAEEFLKLLVSQKEYFTCVSDHALQLLTTFFHLPDGRVSELLNTVSAPKADYAARNFFRLTFTPDQVWEICETVKQGYSDSPVALSYFYKAAMAKEVARKFIISICADTRKSDPDTWQLSVPEVDTDSEIPMLTAGKKQYSLHIINPGMTGWGIRKDKKALLALPEYNPDFEGALFFSWKEYETGAVLIWFDAFIDKTRFQEMISAESAEYVKLPIEEIRKTEDQRQAFLESASDAVMGVETVSDPVTGVDTESSEPVSDAVLDVLGPLPPPAEPEKKFKRAVGKIFADAQDFVKDTFSAVQTFLGSVDLKLGFAMGGKTTLIKYNTIFVQRKFPDDGGAYEILQKEEFEKIQTAIGKLFQKTVFYFRVFCLDKSDRLILCGETDLFAKENCPSEITLPAKTKMVWVAVSTEEETLSITEALRTGEKPGKPLSSKLFWIVYGPEKTDSEDAK